MSERETVLQSLRAALKLSASLPDSRVILSEPNADRPTTLPYLVLSDPSISDVSPPWRVYGVDASLPTERWALERRATVDVQSIGDGGDTLLELATLRCRRSDVRVASAPLGWRAEGPMRSVTALLPAGYERRSILTFAVTYTWTDDGFYSLVEAVNGQLDYNGVNVDQSFDPGVILP